MFFTYEFYELLPETLPLRIFASLPSSLHMLYPMGKDQRLRETSDQKWNDESAVL